MFWSGNVIIKNSLTNFLSISFCLIILIVWLTLKFFDDNNEYPLPIILDGVIDYNVLEEIKKELDTKISRIKSAFIDGLIEVTTLQNELSTLEKELQVVESKLTELNEIKTNSEYKQV